MAHDNLGSGFRTVSRIPSTESTCPSVANLVLMICWPLLMTSFSSTLIAQDSQTTFELRDHDRVVMLGGTFVEREGQFGYLEAAMTTSWPNREVTFRNLGWSGDTVWAESRGIFDPADVGYRRMLELVKELKPTLILLSYGQNESFAGEPALKRFVAQYETLCDDLKSNGARLAFLTPHKFERPQPPLPDASRHNKSLELYTNAVRDLARRRNAPVIDLFALPQTSSNLTENGLHFGQRGYAALTSAVHDQQHWSSLPAGSEKFEAIRQKIVEKNMLFFHRWRPQNITYLTGFRKHEQGNNAVEIAQFDPLVEAIEKQIAELNRK